MISLSSTDAATAATARLVETRRRAGHGLGKRTAVLGAVALAIAAGGCISVKAPDKPIVIELNVNIRQEVVYRLAEDAGNTIQSNPDIF
ncbi:MAG: YnbE family lipoprotein [Novosphingobium sp.]